MMSNGTSEAIQSRLKSYCLLMEEARIRFGVINHAFRNEAGFPAAMAREICYLQFRFLCEIIALGCLVAHGEIQGTQALLSTYEPGKIIKRLERLNPHFYPQPVTQTAIANGHQILATPEVQHLKKSELPTLWGRSGSILHRSPMATTFDESKHPAGDDSDVFEWSAKLTGLLSSHWITLIENKKGMIANLQSEGTGKPSATIFDFVEGKVVNLVTVMATP